MNVWMEANAGIQWKKDKEACDVRQWWWHVGQRTSSNHDSAS